MFCVLFLSILLADKVLVSPYTFNEELLIEHLPENHLNFQFQFTSIWNKRIGNKSFIYFKLKKRINLDLKVF